MPWTVRKVKPDAKGRAWAIFKLKDDGTLEAEVGRSKSKEEAEASVKARYANTGEA